MVTSIAVERLAHRTPYAPDGFTHLNKPKTSIVYDIPGGQLHVFTGDDFRANVSRLKEYAAQIDMAGFDISYWDAMTEVSFNMRKDAAVSAAFFEPDESIRAQLLRNPSGKGREKMFASMVNRLTAPFTDRFNLQVEEEIGWDFPYAGYSTQEVWRTNDGSRSLTGMYISTMAFVSSFTGRGVFGPYSLRYISYLLNPDVILGRVQTGAPISALERAGITEGPVYGVDEEPDAMMRGWADSFDQKTLHPKGINMDKLVAVGIHPEGQNRVYESGRTRGRALDADRKLRERIDPQNGDGAYIAVWRKGRKDFLGIGRDKSFVVPDLAISEPE